MRCYNQPNMNLARTAAAAALAAGCTLGALGPAAGQTAPPAQAPAQTGAATDQASQRAAERIRALQRESEALVTRERSLLAELRKLEIDRALRVEELGQIDRDMARTQKAIADASARADALRQSADTEGPEVQARLVQLYKLGRAGYWRLLLDTDDVRAVGRAYRTAAALNERDRARVEQHAKTLAALAAERQELETRAKAIAALRQRAAQARAEADRAVAARSALIASIDAQRDLNAQLTGELEAAQQKLQATVGELPSGAPVLPLRPFRGALPWPADGILTQRFGRPAAAGGSAPRNGIEISIAEGQPVRAIHEGTVAFADVFTGYGNLIIVDHGDGSYSLYGHLRSFGVERGAHVTARQPIGESGRNPGGNPAVYFELRVDGKPVDPLQWLRKSL